MTLHFSDDGGEMYPEVAEPRVRVWRGTYGERPAYFWTAGTESGVVFAPAWRWVARWDARRAARRQR